MGREKLTRIDDRDFDYWCFLSMRENCAKENMSRIKVEKLINFANRGDGKPTESTNKCYRYLFLLFFDISALVVLGLSFFFLVRSNSM